MMHAQKRDSTLTTGYLSKSNPIQLFLPNHTNLLQKASTYALKCGAFKIIPISTPPIVPATGIVIIHENTSKPTRWKLTALIVPLHRPTPTVAPVMHMEVETGREYCEKRRTVMAAPISMEEPVED